MSSEARRRDPEVVAWERLYRALGDYAQIADATFALHLRLPDNATMSISRGATTKAGLPRRRPQADPTDGGAR